MAEYISKEDVINSLQSRLDSIDQMSYLDKSWEELNIMRDTISNAIDDVYEVPAADVHPVDRWISVKNKLPNDGERVIVYTFEGNVLEMKFYKRRKAWGRVDIDGMNLFGQSFVTHWQPFPEPPKED